MQITDAPAFLGKSIAEVLSAEGQAGQARLAALPQDCQTELQKLMQRGSTQPSLA